ncbi:HIT domain-containing protein [Streptomyces sp. NPDC059631]|uniref:HIT domain-containing protein n=1 Tax=unclassified Streptomyces TaxID=2593676 RepID=UPI0036B9BAD5
MSAAGRRIAPAPRTEWPKHFEDHLAGTGCPICTNDFTAEDIEWGLLISKGPFANTYLWRSGQVRGYVVVIFTARYDAEPTAMTSIEAAGFWNEALAAGRAVEQYYRPLKLNCQLIGNAVPHVHFHITPRRSADQDPAPGGPPPPFDVLDHGRQDEEQLQSDARGLRELLGSTGSSVVPQ